MTERAISQDLVEKLSCYLDGELNADEGKALEARLEEDASLRAYFNDLKLVSNQLQVDALDKDVTIRIKQALQAHQVAGYIDSAELKARPNGFNLSINRLRIWSLRFTPYAVAIILLGVFVWVQVQPTQTHITQDDLFYQYAEAISSFEN